MDALHVKTCSKYLWKYFRGTHLVARIAQKKGPESGYCRDTQEHTPRLEIPRSTVLPIVNYQGFYL